MKDNRRDFLKKGATLAALSVTGLSVSSLAESKETAPAQGMKEVVWPVTFGANQPKLCVGAGINDTDEQLKQYKQIGADYIAMGGPSGPWTVENLSAVMNRFKAQGLTVINMMLGGNQKCIYGLEGRDEEIKIWKESIIAAGKVGLPVIEYNFYAHRLMEGYYRADGRGNSGITAFDYDKGKDIPFDPKEGKPQTKEMLWEHVTYFLKQVVPVAEKAGVRLALHPNDPPVPLTHGHQQIIATFEDWKRLVNVVNSPSNGMTFDCGVSREMGENPLEILHYLAARDRINHVHYRNVTVQKPHLKYEEVFFDTGIVNLYAVMRELFKVKYKHGIYPEHPRELDYDNEHDAAKPKRNGYPGGGGYTAQTYNIAYAKAMMQAVISARQV